MNMMISMMITLSMVMLMLNHPLSMGLILIVQTIITGMIMGCLMGSFFFSYIITIIMLSGTLVLFIYMASVASNEKFKTPFSAISMIIGMLIIITFLIYYYNLNYYNNYLSMNEISLIKLFNMITAQLTMMMIIYLLFTMIAISNIATINEGPLRMKM
uniref:NADH dehydrogenase subunit 6 n=1 Tax=Menida lata TaxID=3028194 RepID=UPI0023D867F6|nr:NADH dehydrogenase subunit 6 [Menida lata]WDD39701.1 NADH dehydrogenase subunit 6 [Menida lata]